MRQINKFVYFIVAILSCSGIFSSNILMVDDVPSPSHRIWNYAIVRSLLERGHNITVLGSKTVNVIVHENFTMYELEDLPKTVGSILNVSTAHHLGIFGNINLKYEYEMFTCYQNMKSSSLQTILNYPNDFFDLLIFDAAFTCLLPLIKKFNYAPSIAVTAFLVPKYVSEKFGNIFNPAYEPLTITTFTTKMTFVQRLQNYIYLQVEDYAWNRKYIPEWERVASEAFGNYMAPMEDLQNHLSLLLCNIVPGLHYSRSLPPNIIPIGGVHIDPVKKLPQDLQEIMDNSKNGIILFSLGTNLKSEDIDEIKIRDILEVFAKLNETVLWKFGSSLKNVPKNVILRKWLPQRDLLAHNNTKLFISHCGGLSTVEAANAGTPILGIPVLVDQFQNAALIKTKKWGKILTIEEINAENFYDSIYQLLHDSEYRLNAQRLSRIVRDRTDGSKERAIFWIEYAIRHNGTHFLNPESKYLSDFIKSSFDVYLFLFVLLVVLLILVKFLISFLKSLILSSTTRKIKVN